MGKVDQAELVQFRGGGRISLEASAETVKSAEEDNLMTHMLSEFIELSWT